MALVLVLLVLAALTVGATTVVSFSSSSGRTAQRSEREFAAVDLAETGVNEAMAVLADQQNNALNPALLPTRTTTFARGWAVWAGTLDSLNGVWSIRSTGYLPNPAGPSLPPVAKTLTARVRVVPSLTGPLNVPAWNYIYATKPPSSGCDETLQQSVNIASPLYVNGNLCLQNTAQISSGPLVVKGWAQLQQQANTIGSATRPISEAHIAGGCQYKNNPFHNPCQGGVDNVYASLLDTNPISVPQPTVSWDDWYQNADPGPYYPCAQASGSVPAFDTSPPDGRNGTYNLAPFNLTPGSSYTCKTAAGELSWNASTRTLTVSGVVFIDGSAYVSNGAVNSYTGQAVLYLSGTLLIKNSKLCAVVTADGSGCDIANWNPNSRLLVIAADGAGGQVNSWDSIQLVSASFQGGLFATNAIDTDTTSVAQGPMVGSAINLGQSVATSFPTITIVPTGMPGGNPTIYAQPQPPVYG